MSLLDCGCGPGTITVGLAEAVAPGEVRGVDVFDDQFALGRKRAIERGLDICFHRASVYQLPFEDGRFDAVFAHALLEHLRDPVGALREMARVLRPRGLMGVCSPDWGGFIVSPHSPPLDEALADYVALKRVNGGDPLAGRHLGEWILAAGMSDLRLGASYEVYEDPALIANFLAEQLDATGRSTAAHTMRSWTSEPAAMFAQAWVFALGRSPADDSARVA
jgi:SAM-dependent methyltransferase